MNIGGVPTDQAVLIQNDAFFFQKEDTDTYFRANGIALSRDELNRLQMLSEGWVASLSLQLIRYLREGTFEATDNLIRAVIWKHLEPEEQRFLIAVFMLERFTVEQAYILLEKDTLPADIVRLLGGGPFSNRADWNDSWTFGQPSVLYLFWSASGALDRELACMDECLPYYIRLTEGHETGADSAMRAEALLMRGEDTAAEALCHKAIYLAGAKEQDSICFAAEMTLLRIVLLNGDVTGFENVRKSILKRVKTGTEPAVKRMADLALAFVSVLTGDNAVPEWLTDLERIKGILYNVSIPFGVLTYLRWLLPKEQDAKLLGIAQGVLPTAEQHHFLLPQVYFHLFIAIAHHRLGQNKEAEAALD